MQIVFRPSGKPKPTKSLSEKVFLRKIFSSAFAFSLLKGQTAGTGHYDAGSRICSAQLVSLWNMISIIAKKRQSESMAHRSPHYGEKNNCCRRSFPFIHFPLWKQPQVHMSQGWRHLGYFAQGSSSSACLWVKIPDLMEIITFTPFQNDFTQEWISDPAASSSAVHEFGGGENLARKQCPRWQMWRWEKMRDETWNCHLCHLDMTNDRPGSRML